MITAVSLFSGCGGFDWGVTKAGAEIIWANDIDRAAASAYKSLFPQTDFVLSDIKEINNFPTADILIGCYPCTGFSGAARRKWKNRSERDMYQNDKNFLFREFLRALDMVQPKVFFIENVFGMRSAEGGFFLNEQLLSFRERKYNVSIMPLNAAHYGVPQTRKRIFLVGILQEIDTNFYTQPLPEFGIDRKFRNLRNAIHDLPEWPEEDFFVQSFHGHYLTRNRKRSWDEPSFTVVADGHHVPLHPGGEPMRYVGKDKWELQGSFNRRLSWRECARIQELPDEMLIDGTLLDKYRVVGNSVPPRMAEVVSRPAIDWLRNNV